MLKVDSVRGYINLLSLKDSCFPGSRVEYTPFDASIASNKTLFLRWKVRDYWMLVNEKGNLTEILFTYSFSNVHIIKLKDEI